MNKAQLKEYYDKLVNDEIPYFVYNIKDDDFAMYQYHIHIYAGSYNPIHDMHRLVFRSAEQFAHRMHFGNEVVAYELSIVRRQKEFLPFNELYRRLKQFNRKEPVVVTKADFFVKKAGALRGNLNGRNVYFHIGFDTAKRLIADDTILGIQGIKAWFIVYPRDGVGIETLDVKPVNFIAGEYAGEYVNGVSSTAIREKQENANAG